MAWVSVHDTVDGSKLRELSKSIGCTKEEALGTLVLLWMWGLKNADKFGRIVGADKNDILDAFSMKLVAKVPNIADLLIENGWIDVEENVLILHDWDQWQSLWYKYNERKEKDVQRKAHDRRKKNKAENAKNSEPVPIDYVDQSRGESEEPENICFLPKEDQKPAKPASKYSEGFEKFWKVYPRKIDKGNAYKKYCTRRKDGFSDEELLCAATTYAEECRKLHTEPEYIKHPKTFLSDSLPFTDYIKKDSPKQQSFELPDSSNPFEDWGDAQ